MKRFARALVVALGIAVLASVVSLVPQKTATGAGGAPVIITSPLPLPVTGNVNSTISGTVGVNNFPAFPATLTGATVPVSGTVAASLAFASHLGVKPSQFVNLVNGEGVGTGSLGPWQQLGTDGSLTSFSIPQGQVLVITDIELNVDEGTPGDTVSAILQAPGSNVIWTSQIVLVDAHGHARITDHLTSGLALTYLPGVGVLAFANIAFQFNLQGYLTAAQ